MDMYDFGNRVNIHGQRKIVNPEVTMLWDRPTTTEDVISLGWYEGKKRRSVEIPREKGLMASVYRGPYNDNDIEEITKIISHGNIITERYCNHNKLSLSLSMGVVFSGLICRIMHPQLLPLPTSFPKIFPSHRNVDAISTFSSLSSNSGNVISRLQATREDARRLSSQEEREELYNSISEISEYFQEDEDLE
jgi:hypothetical protein